MATPSGVAMQQRQGGTHHRAINEGQRAVDIVLGVPRLRNKKAKRNCMNAGQAA